MARTRYKIFETEYPYFLTCTVVTWLPVFTRHECAKIVLDSLSHMHRTCRWTLFAYVVMENHLHMIAKSPTLSTEVAQFKSFTARKMIDWLQHKGERSLLEQLAWEKAKHKTDREFQLWQEGSHPKQIESDEMMEQKLEYIHSNPVRRGYVDEPVHWRYSSARNYHGMESLVPVVTDWKYLSDAIGEERKT
jgi:REP element-mobilizing transposase RayT